MILTTRMIAIPIGNKETMLVNLLSGAVILLENNIYKQLSNLKHLEFSETHVYHALLENKFLFENSSEEDNFLSSILNSINELDMTEAPNFVILPTYTCNLCCTYCYEGIVQKPTGDMTERQVEAAKSFIESKAKNYDPLEIRISLMGGEPLLIRNWKLIQNILDWANKSKYQIDIVTNGTTLHDYVNLLQKYPISSIQITVDGPQKIHDSRRLTSNGNGSFSHTINGIDLAITNKIMTYIRVNIDLQNISHLIKLGDYLVDRYGKDNKYLHPYLYIMSDGGCLGNNYCLPEVKAVSEIYMLMKNNTNMNVFDIAFHGSNFIKGIFGKTNYFPQKRFCAANKRQYVLGPEGNLYKCWFGVGDQKYSFGTYYPEIRIDTNIEELWKNRCIENIQMCSTCKFSLICGGGCNNKAMKKNLSIMTPNCADFHNLLKLGFNHYMNIESGILM